MEETFAQYFAHWGIRLPDEAVQTRQRGEIRSQGWRIQYLFGQDERGEYLDFYAVHRMTNDRHVRIYASGERLALPAYLEFIITPANATPEQKRQAEEAYRAENRRVAEELRRKGFAP